MDSRAYLWMPPRPVSGKEVNMLTTDGTRTVQSLNECLCLVPGHMKYTKLYDRQNKFMTTLQTL